jgi:hypothetical protein
MKGIIMIAVIYIYLNRKHAVTCLFLINREKDYF